VSGNDDKVRPLTTDEFRERLAEAEPAMTNAIDWLRYEMLQHIEARSFGAQTLELTWEDGRLRTVRWNNGGVMRLGKNGVIPVPNLDSKPKRP
jgi:hypothetical protein